MRVEVSAHGNIAIRPRVTLWLQTEAVTSASTKEKQPNFCISPTPHSLQHDALLSRPPFVRQEIRPCLTQSHQRKPLTVDSRKPSNKEG